MRIKAIVSVLTLCWASSTMAQSPDWVVVPVVIEGTDEAWAQPTADLVSRSLSAEGLPVESPIEAVRQFEERGSTPSTEVTDTDIEEWVARSQQAIRQLARGDYPSALEELKEAQGLSRKAVDELNREQNRAQEVLDTCLYLARALLETGNRTRARRQAEECVQLVPRGTPSRAMHPPTVLSLYQEAVDRGNRQTGSLSVTSEPSGCAVRINGIRFGVTPFEMSKLFQGEYQVQVECEGGPRGRVHPVTVGQDRATVFVDVDFDRAIRTGSTLRLEYSSKEEARKRQESDAEEIARVLGAGVVVLASRTSIDSMQVEAVGGLEARRGLARIDSTAIGPTAADAAAAASTLSREECTDFTGVKPVSIACGEVKKAEPPPAAAAPVAAAPAAAATAPAQPPVAVRPPKGQRVAGITLASIGAGGLVAGYALHAVRGGIDVAANDAEGLERWLNTHTWLVVSSAAGSAMLVTAMPLVLPYKRKTPWWAWLSGGIGVGLAAASIATGVTADGSSSDSNRDCFQRGTPLSDTCKTRGQQTDRAVLFGVTAAPLLTMPLVYLLRKDEKKVGVELTPALAAGPQGGSFSLSGRF